MRHRIGQRRKPFALCFVILLAFAGGTHVIAGPLPMPLEAHLDLAEHVVVGELTQMQETDVRRGGGVRWGRATVAVRETLKGQAAKTLSFLVASWVDSNYGGSSPPHVYRNGDSGIWLIKRGGTISHTCGLLAENRKDEVQLILESLAQRKWSDQVNGLKAWAGVVQPHYGHPNPVIIFAVNNSSKADVWYPVPHAPGVVTARVESPDKRVFEHSTSRQRHGGTVFCRTISSGETVYLHPDHSFIDLAWQLELPPGKYKASVTYQNARDGESATGPARRVPVEAWKGVLKAPDVELVLAPPKEEGNKRTTKRSSGRGQAAPLSLGVMLYDLRLGRLP